MSHMIVEGDAVDKRIIKIDSSKITYKWFEDVIHWTWVRCRGISESHAQRSIFNCQKAFEKYFFHDIHRAQQNLTEATMSQGS